jgi:SAM-dependent methyltransferase
VSRRESERSTLAGRRTRPSSPHPDPWRDADAQTNVDEMAKSLEARGRTPAQARLRRRFLKFVPVRPGERVLEVGCGTGVVVRDLAAKLGFRDRHPARCTAAGDHAFARGIAQIKLLARVARGKGVAERKHQRRA